MKEQDPQAGHPKIQKAVHRKAEEANKSKYGKSKVQKTIQMFRHTTNKEQQGKNCGHTNNILEILKYLQCLTKSW